MIYKVILSDRDFAVVDDISDKIEGIRWDYNRIGGCGNFSFSVAERYCREIAIGLNFNVKIYRLNPSTRNFDLWYQGRIENKRSRIRGIEEEISVEGMGYQSQLADIDVDADYTSKTIEFIVDDIMDTYVTPNTNITKGTISATGFTADSLKFNTDALKAIQTCADIVGTREWGVDKDRNFTFQAKSTTVNQVYSVGGKLTDLEIDYDSKELVNRIIVVGGDVSGSPFTRVANDTNSQSKWGRRDHRIQNSAIVTNAVADQYATAIFADRSDIKRRSKVKIVDEAQFESNIPLGTFQVLTDTDTFGTRRFGEGLFNEVQAFDIERIKYRLNRYGDLTLDIQLERPAPTEFEKLAQLEFKINQVAQQGV